MTVHLAAATPQANRTTREPPQATKVKVVYVMGAGRSGSTALGVTLGNCPGIFYAGELDAWLRHSGEPNFGGSERLEFWHKVKQAISVTPPFGSESWRCLEHSLSLLRLNTWRARNRLRPVYRRFNHQLYSSIAQASTCRCVIDSAHYPLRALELRNLPGIEFYVLYLVRDPDRVLASFQRRDVTNPYKSRLATRAYMLTTLLLSSAVFSTHPVERRMLVRYEDFVADPGETVNALLRWLGMPAVQPDFARLRTGIPFQGNRLLEDETIALSDTRPPATQNRRRKLSYDLVLSRLRPSVRVNVSAGS